MKYVPPKHLEEASQWELRVARCIVPLVARIPYPQGRIAWWLTSGFVVEVGSRWFWMTANHSLADLEELLRDHPDAALEFRPVADPECREIAFRYDQELRCDPCGTAMATLEEIEMSDEQRMFFRQLISIDVGFMVLSDYYVNHLRAAQIMPLVALDVWDPSQVDWNSVMESGDLRFYIAGLPIASAHFDHQHHLQSLALKTLPIWPVSQDTPELVFRPAWEDNLSDESLAGASGGPAFVVLNGDAKWFGVQSGTYGREDRKPSELRIALATPIFNLMVQVDRFLGNRESTKAELNS